MNTLVTIPQEIAAWMGQHLKDHASEMTAEEIEVLEKYRADENILYMMGFSFFIEWENAERIRPTVRQWTEQSIKYLLEAEK